MRNFNAFALDDIAQKVDKIVQLLLVSMKSFLLIWEEKICIVYAELVPLMPLILQIKGLYFTFVYVTGAYVGKTSCITLQASNLEE